MSCSHCDVAALYHNITLPLFSVAIIFQVVMFYVVHHCQHVRIAKRCLFIVLLIMILLWYFILPWFVDPALLFNTDIISSCGGGFC
jgi:antibiotic biosynthesis monooxygenase (ABM) superfamily enzyme